MKLRVVMEGTEEMVEMAGMVGMVEMVGETESRMKQANVQHQD